MEVSTMGSKKGYLGNEKGMVLVVALMLLITLTVLGLAAISTTSTEIKISGNERMNTQALDAAEAGVRELLFRMNEAPGSNVTVDGETFDASIQDPGQTPAGCTSIPDPCINPAWNAKIFFTAAKPGDPDADTIYTRTLLPATDAGGMDMWALMNYSADNTGDAEDALSVRYATEADFLDSLVQNNDDGDRDDIVYYDRINDQRVAALGTGGAAQVNGTVDYNPPAGLIKDDAIRIVTIKGSSGNARKPVTVELTRLFVNPNIGAAVTAGIQLKMNGSSFISGFNHDKDTQKDEYNDKDNTEYNNNGCDNFGKKGDTSLADCPAVFPDPEDGLSAQDDAFYSGHIVDPGYNKAGLLYEAADGPPTFTGNEAAVWGGDADTPWAEENSGVFPEFKTMLNVTESELADILDAANVTNANADTACPNGVTYIEGGQTYEPPSGCDSGSGILYVKGDAKFKGNFEFRGLIYVDGDLELAGGDFILGAVAVKGDTNGLKFQSGDPTILYSHDGVEENVNNALNKIGEIFTFLSWREG
jgi:hypothetical protein